MAFHFRSGSSKVRRAARAGQLRIPWSPAARRGAAMAEKSSDQGSREQQRQESGQQGGRGARALQRRSWAPNVASMGLSPFSLVRRMMEDMDLMLDEFGTGRTFGTTRWSDVG